MNRYQVEDHGDTGRVRHGSPLFYELLEEMANLHDRKSHDYASDNNPSGNYHFAGQMAAMFAYSPEDAGFIGRIAEKIYRLANLESGGKIPKNESVEDTERDICVITALWMADRRNRRYSRQREQIHDEIDKIRPELRMTLETNKVSSENENESLLTKAIRKVKDMGPEELKRFISTC